MTPDEARDRVARGAALLEAVSPGLGKILEEMERTDPVLREMAKECESAWWRVGFYARIDERRASEGKPPLRSRS